jgi:hypothetical protein
MRTVAVGFVLVVFAGVAIGQKGEKGDYPSGEGKYSVKFPGTPKTASKTTRSAVGELTVNVATYANSDGNVYMVSYTDFPEAATKPENHATLLDGIRDGVKGKDGKIAGEEKKLESGPDKLPGREFTVEKGKQRIRYRVIVSGSRVYQVAAIGTEAFATGKDATAFLDSFQVTK